MKTARIVLLTDASFANTREMKSHLGFLVLMMDNDGGANIIHYGSNWCKRVTRNVMESEIHALVLGFDYAYIIKDMVRDITGMNMPIEAIVDSRTVFDVIEKDGLTTERRLQIDICALRESYSRGELARISWIPGHVNPSDVLTKISTKMSTLLLKLMMESRIEVRPIGWATVSSSSDGAVSGVLI